MRDCLKFDFSEMQVYDDYLIVIINEGLTVMPKHNEILVNVVDTYYRKKNFVYISYRIHSYSVNPATYLDTSKIQNLVGFAVVSKDYKAKSNVEVEKLFFTKPFESFSDLDEAISWSKTLVYPLR